MAQRLFGGIRRPRSESARQVAELEDLAQKLPGRYTRSVPGAERMSRWGTKSRKAARLADTRSGNKDISEKSKGWTVRRTNLGVRLSRSGHCRPAGIMQDDR